ncbi:hypothetical protein [Shewanella vesiculosa]|uniref:hypothetical protein n=1 Tax=Shewanella vesiculosa TaxID=518738 RepID=UPI002358D471|nr:hypothetical protein [Shewanella vesiculosa]NCP76371.1 hypothetical protein [Shewanella vesiculosa]
MSNNRPNELNEYIEKASEQNDQNIIAALEKIEDPKNWRALKPTVSTISSLTKLSRNTIRNRQWALDRLKSIKQKRKDTGKAKTGESGAAENESLLPDKLRLRIKAILEQNALLYQEILSLQQMIRKKDLEILDLKRNQRF